MHIDCYLQISLNNICNYQQEYQFMKQSGMMRQLGSKSPMEMRYKITPRKTQYPDSIIDSFLDLSKKTPQNNTQLKSSNLASSVVHISNPSWKQTKQPQMPHFQRKYTETSNKNDEGYWMSPAYQQFKRQRNQKKSYGELRKTHEGYTWKKSPLYRQTQKEQNVLRQTENREAAKKLPNFLSKNKLKTQSAEEKDFLSNQNQNPMRPHQITANPNIISKTQLSNYPSQLRYSFNTKLERTSKDGKNTWLYNSQYSGVQKKNISELPSSPMKMLKSKLSHARRRTYECCDLVKEVIEEEQYILSIQSFELGLCKGEGKYGKIYPARHKRTGFLCCIKKINKKFLKDNLDKFITMFKLQSIMESPYIVQLYGIFHDIDDIYLVLELMQGGSLYNYLKIMKTLPEKEAANKLKDICLGIQVLHEADIMHRDLRPENILISNGMCKINDFGRAISCSERRNTLCGMKAYICPQLLQGSSYDNSMDIWCLGVMGYQMMTGKTPFYNMSRKCTIKKIAECEIDFPQKLSPECKNFILNVLRKDPLQRSKVDIIIADNFFTLHCKQFQEIIGF